MCSTSLCRGRSERSTGSRTAPARRHGAVSEGVVDSGDGDDLPDCGRADEQPLIRARPGEQEPAAVRRPEDAVERARPDEYAPPGGAVGAKLRVEPEEAAVTSVLHEGHRSPRGGERGVDERG